MSKLNRSRRKKILIIKGKQKDLGIGKMKDKFLLGMVRASEKIEVEFVLANVVAGDLESNRASNIGGVY